jgi:hypothetical protein
MLALPKHNAAAQSFGDRAIGVQGSAARQPCRTRPARVHLRDFSAEARPCTIF